MFALFYRHFISFIHTHSFSSNMAVYFHINYGGLI